MISLNNIMIPLNNINNMIPLNNDNGLGFRRPADHGVKPISIPYDSSLQPRSIFLSQGTCDNVQRI